MRGIDPPDIISLEDPKTILWILAERERSQSISRITDQVKTSAVDIEKLLDTWGIPKDKEWKLRTKTRWISHGDSGQSSAVNFFSDVKTEEQAYWLGFLAADGSVNYNKSGTACLSLGLGHKDAYHLFKFKNAIEATNSFYIRHLGYYKCDGAPRYSISTCITNGKIGDSLIAYGIKPKKSYDLDFPNNLPDNLIRHFCRGYFDGDGTVAIGNTRINNHTYQRGLVMLVGTESFLKSFASILQSVVGTIHGGTWGRTGAAYTITWSGNDDVKKILEWMYGDATVALDRKQLKAAETLGILADIETKRIKDRRKKYRNITGEEITEMYRLVSEEGYTFERLGTIYDNSLSGIIKSFNRYEDNLLETGQIEKVCRPRHYLHLTDGQKNAIYTDIELTGDTIETVARRHGISYGMAQRIIEKLGDGTPRTNILSDTRKLAIYEDRLSTGDIFRLVGARHGVDEKAAHYYFHQIANGISRKK